MNSATLYRTHFPDRPSLLQRVKEALSILQCQCGPVFIEESTPASDVQAAGCGYIRMSYDRPSVGWQGPNPLKYCEGCPRFQAYRQGVAAGKYGVRNLGMVIATEGVKPDVCHGNGETAEVDHVDAQTELARAQYVHKTDFDAHANPVIDPVAPGVVDTQHSPKHGDGQCDGLKDIGLMHKETPIVAQGGAA